MASPLDTEDDVFETLSKKVDPKIEDERTKLMNERIRAEYEAAQRRLEELIGSNSTLPITINAIKIIGATNTRKGFLDRLFNPIISADTPYTLKEALQAVGTNADKLRRLDIYHDSISMFIDKADKADPSTTTSDIDVFLAVKEKSRLVLKSGTDLGNTEGSAYANLLLRNIFGGAESLNLNAAAGTRTRSSYSAIFETPVLSNPDIRVSIEGLASSTQKPWASHEEVLKGGGAKVKWTSAGGSRHEVGYTGLWRQITALASSASATVRNDAGDSVKSSITHTWIHDKRDFPLMPTRGYLLKTTSEIAGWGPLQGDVGFWKSELETSTATSLRNTGISLTSSFRAGLLYPLPVGLGSTATSTRINDRFHLGGPTDVRGFSIAGLGPRDGPDALGGDVYAAASANLLLPFPRIGRESPLRWQVFANGGRLLALRDGTESVSNTVAQLAKGLPSLAAGVGVVYAHPVARFELNFALPLVMRRGEEARKGLQFGVGISFL